MAAIEVSVDLVWGGRWKGPGEEGKTKDRIERIVRAWGGLRKRYRLATADRAINPSHAHAHAGKTVELEPIDEGIGFSPRSH